VAICNVTPDSFYAASRTTGDDAIARGLAAFDAGAAIVDVGGESTRPGALRASDEEQIARVVPVIEALAKRGIVSIDTTSAVVARAALSAGATMVNDVSCLSGDDAEDLVAAVRDHGAHLVISHTRKGLLGGQVAESFYSDVVTEVREELLLAATRATVAGLESSKIAVDPGIGFAKSTAHSRALLAALPELVTTIPFALYVGASRKSSLALEGEPAEERLAASLVVALHAERAGVRYLRVHDVVETRRALACSAFLTRGAC
jgi:dihydropteroate synthase